jgi:7-keto-8-aminopelargonate synthetase-like enzyme
LYPAVPEQSARLRYFICEGHTEAELDHAVQLLVEAART